MPSDGVRYGPGGNLGQWSSRIAGEAAPIIIGGVSGGLPKFNTIGELGGLPNYNTPVSTYLRIRSNILESQTARNSSNFGQYAAKEPLFSNQPNSGNNLWRVGDYKEIRGSELGLDAHHVGQKALMKNFAPSYQKNTAPSILVPEVGHTIRGPYGIVSRSTTGISNARQLLARDIFELRRVYGSQGIPNNSLQQLIQMNKTKYPDAFIKIVK